MCAPEEGGGGVGLQGGVSQGGSRGGGKGGVYLFSSVSTYSSTHSTLLS